MYHLILKLRKEEGNKCADEMQSRPFKRLKRYDEVDEKLREQARRYRDIKIGPLTYVRSCGYALDSKSKSTNNKS